MVFRLAANGALDRYRRDCLSSLSPRPRHGFDQATSKGVRGGMEPMTELAERMAVSVVGLLVLVGFATSYLLWTIDTASPSGESLFALYLSMDLIAFAMITYVYRLTKLGDY